MAAIPLLCAVLFALTEASVASAESVPLTVDVAHVLGAADTPVTVRVTGQVSQSLYGARLTISFIGPVAAEQVGQTTVDATSAHQVSWWLGAAPVDGTGAEIPVLSGRGSSTARQLRDGDLTATVVIPAGSVSTPGAYQVSADVTARGEKVAGGLTWLGRAAVREVPLDVSFVLPVYLGIHRDPSGKYFDQALEKATLPIESGSETLRALVTVPDQAPAWRFTLAIEPILLTQLRDMADGYVYGETGEEQSEVGANDLAAQNAAAAISDLAGLAAREEIEIVAGSHAGADLTLLASEGWRDGLESLQMGKEELQSTLGIQTPLGGAYVPDLNITGASLGYYADASIEHVVVSSDVVGLLAELPGQGTVAVRAENSDNDRATLMFTASAVDAAVRAPWDVNIFGAAVAAELARTSPNALVIAPKVGYGLIPARYLQQVGAVLTTADWIRTQKLEDLLSLHSPDSRPILLDDSAPAPEGYIADRIWDSVLRAHTPVSDLASATEANNAVASQALRLLFVAQSRWWSRSGVSPQEASMGLSYAQQAELLAGGQLGELTFAGTGTPLISAGSGAARVSIENGTDYLVRAELRLAGEGLSFPDGDTVAVELQPGRTDLVVNVVKEGEAEKLVGTLVVGTTVVDQFSRSLNSMSLWTILPWVIVVVVLLVGGGVYMLLRRRMRKAGGEHAP